MRFLWQVRRPVAVSVAAVIAALLLADTSAEACWRRRARCRPYVCPRPGPIGEGHRGIHPGPTTKLRVLLIGDTLALSGKDKQGRTVTSAADELQHVRAALEVLPPERCDRGDEVAEIAGPKVTPRSIIDAVRAWKVRPSEAIFCYFTSHGAYDPTRVATDPSRGHYFHLEERGDLLQTELLRELLAKNARLTVLMGDSCNDVGERVKLVARNVMLTETGPGFAESLFLGHTGVVNLNSAERGKLADTGGMSRALLRVTGTPQGDPNYNRLRNWAGFLNRLSDETFAISGNDYRPVVYQADVRPAALPPQPPGPRQVERTTYVEVEENAEEP
jgi:hypothetical protein